MSRRFRLQRPTRRFKTTPINKGALGFSASGKLPEIYSFKPWVGGSCHV